MNHLAPLLTAVSLAAACALLSVFVVWRRWAFIGEGIAHSGFGGAGCAWLLMLAVPSLDTPDNIWAPYAGVVLFCLATGLAIGFFTRRNRINSDAAIGIFLVASLAWGILAQHVYRHVKHVDPAGFETFLFGQMNDLSLTFGVGAAMLCGAVMVVIIGLWRQIVAYCLDPISAEASGVPVRFVHYLLVILVTLTIIVGVRLAGNVLVTALLVLPGAAALVLCRQLRLAVALSIIVALTGAVGGVLAHQAWVFIPAGPAIVLIMFLLFLVAYGVGRSRGTI